MHGVTIRLHANKITIYTLDSRTIAQPAIKHSLENRYLTNMYTDFKNSKLRTQILKEIQNNLMD
jgi:hypothetical protein